MNNTIIASKIYDSKINLNEGWKNHKDFINLDRSDRLKVSRIINNWIRQDFY